jgi:eukaryotic-like serine/threonine-protein kinase
MYMEDWSRDGQYLATDIDDAGNSIVAILPLAGDRKLIQITKAPATDEPHFSPDTRWIAYSSNESGAMEVSVAPVPPTGERWQISTKGGAQPRWRGDGRELYYLALDGTLMAVDIDNDGKSIQAGRPHALFQTGVLPFPAVDQYAVSADGRRFLVNVPFDAPEQTSINIVLNWTASLKQ